MRVSFAAALAVSLLALAACSKPSQPKAYDYPAWGFGITFPTPPTVTEAQATANSPHSLQAEEVVNDVHLVVIAMDSQTAGQTDQQLLASVPDEMVTSSGGTYKSARDVTAGKTPGRELVIDRGQDPTERARVFVVKGRVYQVITQTPEGQDDADATKFLNSFHFLGQPS